MTAIFQNKNSNLLVTCRNMQRMVCSEQKAKMLSINKIEIVPHHSSKKNDKFNDGFNNISTETGTVYAKKQSGLG